MNEHAARLDARLAVQSLRRAEAAALAARRVRAQSAAAAAYALTADGPAAKACDAIFGTLPVPPAAEGADSEITQMVSGLSI